MNKQVILISVFVVLLLLGLILFFVFNKPKAKPSPKPKPEPIASAKILVGDSYSGYSMFGINGTKIALIESFPTLDSTYIVCAVLDSSENVIVACNIPTSASPVVYIYKLSDMTKPAQTLSLLYLYFISSVEVIQDTISGTDILYVLGHGKFNNGYFSTYDLTQKQYNESLQPLSITIQPTVNTTGPKYAINSYNGNMGFYVAEDDNSYRISSYLEGAKTILTVKKTMDAGPFVFYKNKIFWLFTDKTNTTHIYEFIATDSNLFYSFDTGTIVNNVFVFDDRLCVFSQDNLFSWDLLTGSNDPQKLALNLGLKTTTFATVFLLKDAIDLPSGKKLADRPNYSGIQSKNNAMPFLCFNYENKTYDRTLSFRFASPMNVENQGTIKNFYPSNIPTQQESFYAVAYAPSPEKFRTLTNQFLFDKNDSTIHTTPIVVPFKSICPGSTCIPVADLVCLNSTSNQKSYFCDNSSQTWQLIPDNFRLNVHLWNSFRCTAAGGDPSYKAEQNSFQLIPI